MKKRVLFLDIEISAPVMESWSYYDGNALRVLKDWQLMMMGYKWRAKGKSKKVEILDLPGHGMNEKKLVMACWKLLDEADVVIAHNGDKFDLKKLNAKFVEHGLTPPSPFHSVDTIKIARRVGFFTSNKLDELGRVLGCGRKVSTGGYSLWVGCLEGDLKAWRKMARYCKQDVRLLEEVYDKLAPFDKQAPRLSLKPNGCPNCGSTRLRSHGWMENKAGTTAYRRYRCMDCGKICRDRQADKEREKPSIVSG